MYSENSAHSPKAVRDPSGRITARKEQFSQHTATVYSLCSDILS